MELGPLQKKWIESLEAHPERQGKSSLGIKAEDGTYQACCLGEGGLIAGICEWGLNGALHEKGSTTSQFFLIDLYPVLGLRCERGSVILELVNEDTLPADIKIEQLDSLSVMNDFGSGGDIPMNPTCVNLTWAQIASILRSQPQAYFTESK